MRAEVPDPAGDGGYPTITSALIKLGLSQDGKALETLGEAIGLSGFGLDTEGAADDSRSF